MRTIRINGTAYELTATEIAEAHRIAELKQYPTAEAQRVATNWMHHPSDKARARRVAVVKALKLDVGDALAN